MLRPLSCGEAGRGLKLADDGCWEENNSSRLLFFVSLCVFVTWWFKKTKLRTPLPILQIRVPLFAPNYPCPLFPAWLSLCPRKIDEPLCST